MDVEESCIQEAIGQFYSFFGIMTQLKNSIGQLSLDQYTRNTIYRQLDNLEREYKYGPEWFMTRGVQDVRVGVVGSENSLKTAIVSLFVEGVLEIEGDEKDGRSKSKINVDGKCRLLLIREETGVPSRQLCQWIDVLLLVFSYSDDDSLLQVRDYYRIFRETNPDAPVMLVGVKDEVYSFRRTVRDGDVRKTAEMLDKCQDIDVSLNQESTNALFAQACKLAMSSASYVPTTPKFPSPSHLQCPNPGYTGTGISLGLVAAGVQKFSAGMMPPVSPSHAKRAKQRRSMFGGKQTVYGVSKSTESFGSGRPVPVKEGFINKKSTGLRGEWKRKYLELSQDELTYYPSLNDYMAKTHGKSLKLQQITVKVPGQRVSSVSKVANTPSESTTSDFTESLTNSQAVHSDHSNSGSPPPFESSLEVSYNSLSGNQRPSLTLTKPSFDSNREYFSPEHDDFSSSEQFDEMGVYVPPPNHRYDQGPMTNGRGHNRNGSLDESSYMLQQLRTGGISYPPIEEDRSATMPRLDTRKNKPRQGSLVPSNDDLLSAGGGSQDSLGRPDKQDRKRKGDKDRNSFVLDRTQSESSKEKKIKGGGHKRQRSWASNKLLDTETGADIANESCEFHVFSADNKVWCFEAASIEEAASWVKVIGDQIKKTISESVSHKRGNSSNEHEKREILTVEGNQFCTDCNSPNPEWASLNHGCVLCIECSGVHRNLGTHISRIRSLELDDWSPELISVMLQIGNKMSQSLWEFSKPKTKPNATTSREERERFIKAKYIDKEFLAGLPQTRKPVYEQLMEAVKTNHVYNCLNILAHATPEDINILHNHSSHSLQSWAPLHVACAQGRIVITQLLIWNGGDIDIMDSERRTPLYYARSHGHQEIVNILVANSCTEYPASDTSV